MATIKVEFTLQIMSDLDTIIWMMRTARVWKALFLMVCLFQVGLITKVKPAFAAPVDNSCSMLFENFCENIWSKENMGDLDIVVDKEVYPIRFGRTQNDLDQGRYAFFAAVLKEAPNYSPEIKKAFENARVFTNIKKILGRKDISGFNEMDIWQPEWNFDLLTDIQFALFNVADLRTEKQIPGFLRKRKWDITPEMILTRDKNRDIVEAEFFKSTWKNNKNWLQTEKLFEVLKEEYISWILEKKEFTADLKREFVNNLKTLTLQIPGSAADRMSVNYRDCGIDQRNAAYNYFFHTVTVCAGLFNSNYPLLTLAHEMGHAIGGSKRLFQYRLESALGKQLISFWDQSCRGHLMKCEDWKQFKKDYRKNSKNLKAYKYSDEEQLRPFLSRDIIAHPPEKEIMTTAERLSKKTLRTLAGFDDIQSIIQKTSVLFTGDQIPNYMYLNFCRSLKSTHPHDAVLSVDNQFLSLFTNEYSCQKEKNLSDVEALKKSLLESTELIKWAWYSKLTVGGKYSDDIEANEAYYSQDIEEDVVDNYASQVTARILKNLSNTESRRNLFFTAAALSCDPPSFQKIYPEEARVLNHFSNKLHSGGLDRRVKILVKDIKHLLECQ